MREGEGEKREREEVNRRREEEQEGFFFNETATTEIYTLALHDALPISSLVRREVR